VLLCLPKITLTRTVITSTPAVTVAARSLPRGTILSAPINLAQCNAQSLQTDEAVANELLSGVEDFSTAASVNRYLGNLLKQIARKRIHGRDAIAQAYVCQLLLNSLPALDRQRERENPEPTVAERHAEFLAQLRANMLPGRYPSPSASTDPGPKPESHDDLQPAYEGHR
jgi:hypothetical protein